MALVTREQLDAILTGPDLTPGQKEKEVNLPDGPATVEDCIKMSNALLLIIVYDLSTINKKMPIPAQIKDLFKEGLKTMDLNMILSTYGLVVRPPKGMNRTSGFGNMANFVLDFASPFLNTVIDRFGLDEGLAKRAVKLVVKRYDQTGGKIGQVSGFVRHEDFPSDESFSSDKYLTCSDFVDYMKKGGFTYDAQNVIQKINTPGGNDPSRGYLTTQKNCFAEGVTQQDLEQAIGQEIADQMWMLRAQVAVVTGVALAAVGVGLYKWWTKPRENPLVDLVKERGTIVNPEMRRRLDRLHYSSTKWATESATDYAVRGGCNPALIMNAGQNESEYALNALVRPNDFIPINDSMTVDDCHYAALKSEIGIIRDDPNKELASDEEALEYPSLNFRGWFYRSDDKWCAIRIDSNFCKWHITSMFPTKITTERVKEILTGNTCYQVYNIPPPDQQTRARFSRTGPDAALVSDRRENPITRAARGLGQSVTNFFGSSETPPDSTIGYLDNATAKAYLETALERVEKLLGSRIEAQLKPEIDELKGQIDADRTSAADVKALVANIKNANLKTLVETSLKQQQGVADLGTAYVAAARESQRNGLDAVKGVYDGEIERAKAAQETYQRQLKEIYDENNASQRQIYEAAIEKLKTSDDSAIQSLKDAQTRAFSDLTAGVQTAATAGIETAAAAVGTAAIGTLTEAQKQFNEGVRTAVDTLSTNMNSLKTGLQNEVKTTLNTAKESVETATTGLNNAKGSVEAATTGLNTALTNVNAATTGLNTAKGSVETATTGLNDAIQKGEAAIKKVAENATTEMGRVESAVDDKLNQLVKEAEDRYKDSLFTSAGMRKANALDQLIVDKKAINERINELSSN